MIHLRPPLLCRLAYAGKAAQERLENGVCYWTFEKENIQLRPVQGRRSVEDAKSSPKAMDIGKIVREEDGFWLRKARGPGRDLSLVPDHRARSPKKWTPDCVPGGQKMSPRLRPQGPKK